MGECECVGVSECKCVGERVSVWVRGCERVGVSMWVRGCEGVGECVGECEGVRV